MIPRPCLRCGTLTTTGAYCPAHRPKNPRGSTRAWRKLRLVILERDGYRCRCGKPATDVDHILPVIQGGTDHPDNLRAGCAHCNRSRRPRSSSLR